MDFLTFVKNRRCRLEQWLDHYIPLMVPHERMIVVDYACGESSWQVAQDRLAGIGTVVTFPHGEIWHMNHARNLACVHSDADTLFVCDVDVLADRGALDAFRCARVGGYVRFQAKGGLFGTCSFSSHDYYAVCGYEEAMVGYGHDDVEFYDRLRMRGCTFETVQADRAWFATGPEPRCLEGPGVGESSRFNHAVMRAGRALGHGRANVGRNWGAGGVVNSCLSRRTGRTEAVRGSVLIV